MLKRLRVQVWVKAKEDAYTVLSINAVANSKHLVRDDIAVMVYPSSHHKFQTISLDTYNPDP